MFLGTFSSIKLAIDFPIIKSKDCGAYYRGTRETIRITSKQFCTFSKNRDKDTCGGDSGSALVALDNTLSNQTYYVVGVVSFGIKDCTRILKPSVNTKVSEFVDWVLNNMYF